MKNLLLILLFLPGLLLSQVDQPMDTIEAKQTEFKGDLKYIIGAEEPFTGIVINPSGEGLDGHFYGTSTYLNGKLIRFEEWNFIDGHRFKETHVLQGSIWVRIGTTTYDSNGNKLRQYDYENNVETYYYENGNIKEEIGKGGHNSYHKFWDRDGNEIDPAIPEAKKAAPLHETLQIHISKYAFMGYFLILLTTIGISIFKLRNVEMLPKTKITLIVVFSVIALIISASISNYININLSYERGGIWGTAFGSLFSVLYIIPYLIQIIALGIAVIGISRKPKKTW